jgi:polar amino acid transport system substrate-binding protein
MNFAKFCREAGASLFLVAVSSVPALAVDPAAEQMKEILSRGVLRVGVQGAIRPWSYRDISGNLVGIEPDIAKEIAKAVGVQLELVQIESSNRVQFLQQDKIDVLVGNMSDTQERRKVVGIVNPDYWASGASILSKKGAIKHWADLSGKPVCAVLGVFYIKPTQIDTGAQVLAFPGKTEAAAALRGGKCVGLLIDDTTAAGLLLSEEWDDYEIPVETKYETPWGAAVKLESRDGPLGNLVSGVLYRMIASGELINLAHLWKVNPPGWLTNASDKLKHD